MAGYPPLRVRRILYQFDIHCLIVIPAQTGIQKTGQFDLLGNHHSWQQYEKLETESTYEARDCVGTHHGNPGLSD